jgi:lysophospholipase L1-like esterase
MVLTLAGCDSPKLEPLKQGDVILAFGDSLTVGVGANKEHSYPSVLARLTGLEIINAGVSGETTEEGLRRLPGVLDEYSPSLMILIEGGNDILRNKNVAEISLNLERMIQMAQSRGIQVVLVGVPEKNLFSNSAPLYRELAERYDLVFEESLIGSLMRSPSKKSDPIHFNQAGYALMAETIYELLSDNGAF